MHDWRKPSIPGPGMQGTSLYYHCQIPMNLYNNFKVWSYKKYGLRLNHKVQRSKKRNVERCKKDLRKSDTIQCKQIRSNIGRKRTHEEEIKPRETKQRVKTVI